MTCNTAEDASDVVFCCDIWFWQKMLENDSGSDEVLLTPSFCIRMIWSALLNFDKAHLLHRPVNTDCSSARSKSLLMRMIFAMSISAELTKDLL